MADKQEKGIVPITIEQEMRGSYLDYAMSVIIGRAIPDIRDGLKPVHRRILYAMFREGLLSSKRFSKSAGVVGEVLKKYHPHGDMAVYDSMVRMAQDWNLRYPLVEGQGNFGSMDGDSAAAYRYTEARLSKLAEEFLSEIDQDTVDFQPNYDGSTEEPIILPATFPGLLVNGTTGIAVGMATNMPPHNLTEVMDAVVAMIDTPSIQLAEIMKIIPGPDLPTGGSICGTEGIVRAYETGRGSITMRGEAVIEEMGNRERIIITEIPYQVNKSNMLEQIADLVRQKRVEGISDLRDESNRDGMRVVVELKKDAPAEIILNQLYSHTQLQDNFGIINLAITKKRPKVFSLKEILQSFIDHRKEVVVRRSVFELRKAQMRAHILEGYEKALDKIDAVIELIRKSQTGDEARAGLVKKFDFTIEQATAILDMRLQRLTGLEREKIREELESLRVRIGELKELLGSREKLMALIRAECVEIKNKFGDKRRTKIIPAVGKFVAEDLIPEEEVVVSLSHTGYIKRNPTDTYRAQKRGGTGKIGMGTKEDDFVSHLFVASTHDFLLLFTDKGRLLWLKVHEIPVASRTAKGRPLVNLVKFHHDEKLCAILPVKKFEEGQFVFMATKEGIVKKTELKHFSNPRPSGIIAISFDDGDQLVGAKLTNGKDEILICTKDGMSIRFSEEEVRGMGRTARGVRGIDLSDGDHVVGVDTIDSKAQLLSVCEFGYGKRTNEDEYRTQSRGGKGIITIKTTDRNGSVVSALQACESDEVMIMTSGGKLIRMKVAEISIIGRNTQGMRLISLDEGEKVSSVARIVAEEVED
ncbi:MAG: DNA gyrase subunit A [Deltaproteobacteria bacterium CG11_big_fil_rev_8_21_14_0_20_45_16]|nr:MAG: DNA gyrase subunit A [Deltaproteobacteria bacterium CG11_big_fil_rev_8_21_14_0_20_45_16]